MLFLKRQLLLLVVVVIVWTQDDDEFEGMVSDDKFLDVPASDEVRLDDSAELTPHLPDESSIVVDRRIEDGEDDELAKKRENYPKLDETLLTAQKNFYTFDVIGINGETVSLKKYRGKVSLVVNVASECGFTDSHYTALVHIQNILGSTGKFTVLAFPCNQFGAQEPGENSQIESFAIGKYNVNFPMFSKIKVLDSGISEAWQYLEEKSGKVPNWNFWKYLVDDDGLVLDAWGPWTSVDDIFTTVKAAVDKLSKAQDPVLPYINSHYSGEL